MDQAEFRCKRLPLTQIWKWAKEVRKEYWPGNILPVDVEDIVEFKLRLDIVPVTNLTLDTDMEAFLRSDLKGIIVDHHRYMEERFVNRMRFSFAHELGHFFIHKDIYALIEFDSAEEWKEILQSMPDAEYRSFEYQANEFAGRLLVPRDNLTYEVENAVVVLKNNNMLDYVKDDPFAVLSRISAQLAKPFGVSTDVIETRVKRENLWPPNI